MKKVTIRPTPETKKTERFMALSVIIPVVGTFLAFEAYNTLNWENFPTILSTALALAGTRLFWRILWQRGGEKGEEVFIGWFFTIAFFVLGAVVYIRISPQWEWLLWLTPWVLTWIAYQWRRRDFTVLLLSKREEGRIPFYKTKGQNNPRALISEMGVSVELGELEETGNIPIHYEVEFPRHGDRIHKKPLFLRVFITEMEHGQILLNEGLMQEELQSVQDEYIGNTLLTSMGVW